MLHVSRVQEALEIESRHLEPSGLYVRVMIKAYHQLFQGECGQLQNAPWTRTPAVFQACLPYNRACILCVSNVPALLSVESEASVRLVELAHVHLRAET